MPTSPVIRRMVLLSDNDLDHEVRQLEREFDNFRIMGGEGTLVEGDLHRGYAIDTGVSGFVDPIGACCHWYGCFDETEAVCLSDGNFPIWMGPGTRCAYISCPSYA